MCVCVCSKKQRYTGGEDENPSDYRVDTSSSTMPRAPQLHRGTRPPTTATHHHHAHPGGGGGDEAEPFHVSNHYAVTGPAIVGAFNNPMYTEGLNLPLDDNITSGDAGVSLRNNGISKEERMLQARSRYSMGPVMMGDQEGETSTDRTYHQMYGTTGTFRD